MRAARAGSVPCACVCSARMCGVADGVSCARRDVERAQLAVAELDKALVVALSPVAALHAKQREQYRIIEGLSAQIAEVENGGLFGAVGAEVFLDLEAEAGDTYDLESGSDIITDLVDDSK